MFQKEQLCQRTVVSGCLGARSKTLRWVGWSQGAAESHQQMSLEKNQWNHHEVTHLDGNLWLSRAWHSPRITVMLFGSDCGDLWCNLTLEPRLFSTWDQTEDWQEKGNHENQRDRGREALGINEFERERAFGAKDMYCIDLKAVVHRRPLCLILDSTSTGVSHPTMP